MDYLIYLAALLAAVGVVGFVTWWFSEDQRARRAMRSIPRRRVVDVITGERARIVGTVEVDRPLVAPLSGRSCVCWRVVVEERRRSGKTSYWKPIIDEHDATDFFLRDGEARALIRTAHVHPVLERDGRFTSGFLHEPAPALERFLAQRGHSSRGLIFNKSMRYREGVAEPGEVVAVVGVGTWERDPDERAQPGAGYREAKMPQRLVIDHPADGWVLISDEEAVVR